MSRKSTGFDTGPLAWVKGEIDSALKRGADALVAFERKPEDAMQIRLAHASLHQAHGAINIVGLDGVTRVSEALEGLIAALDTVPEKRTPDVFALAARAFAELAGYIEDLSKGAANRPLRLLPVYEALASELGRPVDPVDLYYVDLTRKPPPRDTASVRTASEDMRVIARTARGRYQRGFLRWLKSDPVGAEEMRAAVAEVELAQGVSTQRPFWWSALGFLEALSARAIPPALDARRLITRIEQQLKSLSEGSPSISERLMREVLFFVAHAGAAAGVTEQVRTVYGLAETLPAPPATETAQVTVDPGIARARLDETKDAWNRCASGEAPDLSAFCGHLLALRESVTALGHPELTALVARISAAGDWIASDASRMSDAAALEIAAGLLLVEDALAGFDALGEEFQEQSAFIRERLEALIEGRLLRTTPENAAMEEIAQRAQDQLLVSQVAGEMKTNLADIEKALDAYFRDTSRRAELAAVERPMHQLVGAFDILGEDRAKEAVISCLALIRRFAAPDAAPTEDEFGALAQTLSGIGFYVEGLVNGDADFDTAMRPLEAPVIEGFDAEAVVPVAVPPMEVEAAPASLPELSPTVPLEVPPDVTPEVTADTTPPAALVAEPVDPELLPIYLEEAREVLESIGVGLAAMRAGDADKTTLTEVRRGFHTLKGSGRMVGLNRLGEAAWSVEQTMNVWLAEQREVSPALARLVDVAATYFSDSVAALEAGGVAGDDSSVVALATRVRSGEPDAVDESQTVDAPEAIDKLEAVVESPVIDVPSAPELPSFIDTAVDLPEEIVVSVPDSVIPEFAAPAPVDIPASAANESEVVVPAVVVPEAAIPAGVIPDSVIPDAVVRLGENEVSATLFTLFSGEARMHVHTMRAEHEILRDHGIITDEMLRAVHTLGGICGTVQLEAPRDLAHALEHALEQLMISALSEAEQNLVGDSVEALAGMVDAGLELSVPEEMPGLIDRLEEVAAFVPVPEGLVSDNSAMVPEDEGALHILLPQDATPESAPVAESTAATSDATPRAPAEPLPVAEVDDGPVERRRRRIRDELDPELLPVFLEEAAELVPAIGSTLRAWREEPDRATLGREFQRLLHTIKGSARMAGAMGLGELTHYMETRAERALAQTVVSTVALDELDISYDRMVQLHERLLRHGGGAPESSTTLVDSPAAATDAAHPVVTREGGQERVAMLRVRAEVVDKLVNQAGEVSIARSRLEGELRSLNGALSELTGNIARLRAQLREIEIQSEAQMQSHREELNRADGHFDPLEFDRFTRVQELTRFMAESVNDVQTAHQNLVRNSDSMEGALAAQARLNRDLQQDLMRVRMVPLAGLAERLHRIVRQTAKESGKRANLDIHGANVELDRSVLERITAPFEHLLRNAVIHGLETPAERLAQEKPATGEIRLELSQEGNEVALVLADDGRGIDVARIREKATAAGMIRADAPMSDADLADLIFVPGFSTAAKVTESAGRGVGMDVVRTEVASLGGRIAISFVQGKGSRFSIYLPLTLAVTQAVLARAGGKTYAIPTVMVEQVQQLRADALAAAEASGEVVWQGRRYPFRDLARLLELKPAEARRSAPVLFLRSGANALSLAVEEMVSPSEEVVVKSIGPQLARVPGVAGATVLGSGEIVLIINPVSLSQREMPAVAVAAEELAPVPSEQALVMVVDDSLTVRKVSGRLLERAGYRVLTARDGVEALELLAEVVPDAMLVDIEMPRMDGFDLTRNIRGDARLAKVPIVMITSRTADKHQDFAREIGVDAYLGKPYQEEELLARLTELVARR